MTSSRASQWPLVARALVARGKLAEGLVAWRKAAAETPADPVAWASITMILSTTSAGAATAILPGRVAATLAPLAPAVQFSLASALAMSGDTAAATRVFRRALALAPDHGLAHARLGHVAADRNEAVLGLRYLPRAAALDPMDAEAWAGAAWWYFRVELAYDRIERSLKRALASQPAHADALNQMGELFRNLGELAPSLRFYDRCLAVAPSAATERALLLALLYAPNISEEEHFGRHLAYARRYAPERPRPPAEPLDGRRIRIGYLSSGFSDHPTAALTVGLIEARDRARFEVSLFAHIRGPDPMSRRLEASADYWTNLHGLSHEAIADRIREKRLDILVHPAGRHDEVTWSVAALRPAPIQVALYEAATTGIAAFDYLVTDRVLTPRHSTERLVERPLRLPSLPLHELPAEAPPVTPLPALANGHVTFGSLNNSAKLNDGVLALWARTLAAVPGSRLIIKAQALAGRRLPARIEKAMTAAGVGLDRVELMAGFTDSRRAMLQVYDRIDIGLDTVPWAGGMTTFEAMCQGVPVVTLAGRHLLARWGATMAINAGHPELVAETENAFVEIARRLTADLPALARLRAGLRDEFLASPLCNARLKARHLERAFRYMVAASAAR
ncbi:MAG: tetratricopeptide repeat protein [Alphaproteobacteria bacterium]|nr:tetratricopeptide repeat protein [Alphaproteobacteria bacterium]